MGLYSVKPAFVASLRRAEDALVSRKVSADALTFASLPVAALTAATIVAGHALDPLWWLAIAPLSLLRMALNALDGAVARRSGASTRRGAVYNELVDRAADVVTFAACAVVAPAPLALAAVAAMLLSSLVAVLSQALVGRRSYAGFMGKPDRVLVLSVAGAAAQAWPQAFAWALAAVLAGSTASAGLRTRELLRATAEDGADA